MYTFNAFHIHHPTIRNDTFSVSQLIPIQGLLNYLDASLFSGNISLEPFFKKNFFIELSIAPSIFNGALKVKHRLKAYSIPFKVNEIKKIIYYIDCS